MGIEPVVKVQMYEYVYKRIKKGILSGEFLPGEKLNQDQIAQQMNISRMPVRDALRMLEKDGLVVNHLNKGFEVNEFSEDRIKDVLYVRSILESEAVLSLKDTFTSQDISKLEKILQDMRHELNEENYYTYGLQKLNYSFHFVMYNKIKSQTMLQVIERLWESYPNYAMYMRQKNAAGSVATHDQIITALKDCNFEKAAEIMKRHILMTKYETTVP